MSCTACPSHGQWYCDTCADLAARVGVTVPRQGQPRLVRIPYALAPDATEAELRTKLHAFATHLGWLHYHTHDSRQSAPGWPDEALVHPEGGPLYLWELKREDSSSQPSGAQKHWLNALARATEVRGGVYRPADWPTMQRLLTLYRLPTRKGKS